MRMLGCKIWCLRKLATRREMHQKPLGCRLTTAFLLNLRAHWHEHIMTAHWQGHMMNAHEI